MSFLKKIQSVLPGRKAEDEIHEELDPLDSEAAGFLAELQKQDQGQPTPRPEGTFAPSAPKAESPASKPNPLVPDVDAPPTKAEAPVFSLPKPQAEPHAEPDSVVPVWDEEEEEPKKPGRLQGLLKKLPLLHGKSRPKPMDPPKKKVTSKGKAAGKPSGKMILQAGILILLVGAFGFLASRILFPHPSASSVTPVSQDDVATASLEDHNILSENDPIFKNPFVDISGLTNPQVGPDGKPVLPSSSSVSAKKVPSSHASSSTGALPAIPGSYPRPSLPAIPSSQGSIPAPSTPPAALPSQPQQSQNQASVSGVLTGEDGNNMAIMSDGTVVSEGESYKDGRIAYIGGDGIHFEDGSSIPYKE